MLIPAPASAQGDAAGATVAAPGRFRFGPLRFTPSIVLRSLGVDDNVFNEAENPKQDTTAAFGPAVDIWMGLGRSRLSGRLAGEYLYFQKYTTQRALNTSDTLRLETRIGRVTPYVSGSYDNSKNRPGFEIQSRVRQVAESVTFGGDVEVSGRTSFQLSATRARIKYQDDEVFSGVNLAGALNGTTTSEQAQLRYRLTSLTTFVATAEALQDRFLFQRLRNSNSFRIVPGFQLKPSALISGDVAIGFRRLASLEPTVPNYQGLVAAVDAKAVILSRTQIGVQVSRDVTFSYQELQPYYLLTDTGLTITERIGSNWDVVAHGSRQLLDYAHVRSAVPAGVIVDAGAPLDTPLGVPVANQRDVIRQLGGGVGFRFGQIMRLGVDASYYRRSSSDPNLPRYEGLRIGAVVRYGLQQ